MPLGMISSGSLPQAGAARATSTLCRSGWAHRIFEFRMSSSVDGEREAAMDLLNYLKSEAEQVEGAEMGIEATSIEFEANKLKGSTVEETSGTAVRVVRHGRLGFA